MEADIEVRRFRFDSWCIVSIVSEEDQIILSYWTFANAP